MSSGQQGERREWEVQEILASYLVADASAGLGGAGGGWTLLEALNSELRAI